MDNFNYKSISFFDYFKIYGNVRNVKMFKETILRKVIKVRILFYYI